MLLINFGAAMSVLTLMTTAAAAEPSWVREGNRRDGSVLFVTCEASAPARDLAYRFALESCQGTAADMVNGNFVARSMSVETEHSIALHSEISAEKRASGLICAPVNQYTESQETGFHTYLQCRFSLDRVKVESVSKNSENGNKSDQIVQSEIQTEQETNVGTGKIIQSADRHLIVSCIPACDELILTGGTRPRTVQMDANPKSVLIYSDDREMVARKKGYLPQHVILSERRTPAIDNFESEFMEVHLERP